MARRIVTVQHDPVTLRILKLVEFRPILLGVRFPKFGHQPPKLSWMIEAMLKGIYWKLRSMCETSEGQLQLSCFSRAYLNR